MRASTETLEGNKIRLSVEVEEAEVDHAVDDVVRSLSRQARIPGFRPGKVPRRVLEARMGGSVALREEALREALPDFYARAVTDVAADPITPPEIEITSGEQAGPVVFEATVEVRPQVSVAGYQGLEVTVASPQVSDAEVDEQVDRQRETDAELEEVHRPIATGDNVTIDIHAHDDDSNPVLDTDDYLYEVGSGSVVQELDEELSGKSAGDILDFRADLGEDRRGSFRVLVKRVQRKVLPELTDEWVEENTESASVEELKESLRRRIHQVKVLQGRMALREESLKALAELVEDEVVPEVLVEEELGERLRNLEQRLNAQGLSVNDYLQATGHGPDDFVADLREEARQGVKVDLALRAVAEAEELEVSEEELAQELAETAERLGMRPDQLRQRLDRAGRTVAVRSEQRKAKALTWLLDHVELVDADGNAVPREALEVESLEAEGGADATHDQAEGGNGQEDHEAEGDVSEPAPDHGTVTVAGETEEGS